MSNADFICAQCKKAINDEDKVLFYSALGATLFCSENCRDLWVGRRTPGRVVWEEEPAGRVILPGMKDSGAREHFDSGAMREPAEGRYDLISPFFLRRLAIVMEKGAKKYKDRNWEQGFPHHVLVDHLLRHVVMYITGDKSEDHLGHAAFNLMALMHLEYTHPELNDMPKYPQEGEKT